MGAKKKDPNAVALGRKGGKARARNLTPAELSKIGKQAAEGRMTKLSSTKRSEIARQAVKARWAKTKGKGER
jgi:hypothetical protein